MIVPDYPAISSSANKLDEYIEQNRSYIEGVYGEVVLQEMLNAKTLLDTSYIYVKRINALTSGLETPQSFLIKLKLELEELCDT